jgi:hypothetical protein
MGEIMKESFKTGDKIVIVEVPNGWLTVKVGDVLTYSFYSEQLGLHYTKELKGRGFFLREFRKLTPLDKVIK